MQDADLRRTHAEAPADLLGVLDQPARGRRGLADPAAEPIDPPDLTEPQRDRPGQPGRRDPWPQAPREARHHRPAARPGIAGGRAFDRRRVDVEHHARLDGGAHFLGGVVPHELDPRRELPARLGRARGPGARERHRPGPVDQRRGHQLDQHDEPERVPRRRPERQPSAARAAGERGHQRQRRAHQDRLGGPAQDPVGHRHRQRHEIRHRTSLQLTSADRSRRYR